jgi:hypothetical protein
MLGSCPNVSERGSTDAGDLRMIRLIAVTIVTAVLFCGGCGNSITAEFPNRVVGADGQHLILEDIEAIVRDPDLNEDQKRSQLRDLGLEDEELIEALLSL